MPSIGKKTGDPCEKESRKDVGSFEYSWFLLIFLFCFDGFDIFFRYFFFTFLLFVHDEVFDDIPIRMLHDKIICEIT